MTDDEFDGTVARLEAMVGPMRMLAPATLGGAWVQASGDLLTLIAEARRARSVEQMWSPGWLPHGSYVVASTDDPHCYCAAGWYGHYHITYAGRPYTTPLGMGPDWVPSANTISWASRLPRQGLLTRVLARLRG